MVTCGCSVPGRHPNANPARFSALAKPGFEIAPSMKPKHDWLVELTWNVATPELSVVALACCISPGH